jgi:hypothetical protein
MSQESISKYHLNNYRMASYLLFTIGLINLRYQTGKDNVLFNSLLVVIPGAVMLIATFIRGTYKYLARREVMAILAVIGSALVVWAINN